MAGNGHEPSGSERLDRMEATLNMLINDHVQFREEHKMLLHAQVLLTGSLETLRDELRKVVGVIDGLGAKVEALTTKLEALTTKVEALTSKVDALTTNVEAMRSNFDARLIRLES